MAQDIEDAMQQALALTHRIQTRILRAMAAGMVSKIVIAEVAENCKDIAEHFGAKEEPMSTREDGLREAINTIRKEIDKMHPGHPLTRDEVRGMEAAIDLIREKLPPDDGAR